MAHKKIKHFATIDIAQKLWAYVENGRLELWTEHGCVGTLAPRDVSRLVSLLPRLIPMSVSRRKSKAESA